MATIGRERQDDGDLTVKLSTEALESIARLDDHNVEDNDAARADRMLAALEAIPVDERLQMKLDVEAMRAMPLTERLSKLQDLWDVRQQELKEAYDAMPKVNELLMARIEVLQATDSSESAVELALIDLEDLLSDIDMARDFYSLGGFPILTSMLDVSRTEAIRELAAWTIGTAVKNQPQHQLWVLEVRVWCCDRSVRRMESLSKVFPRPSLIWGHGVGNLPWVVFITSLCRSEEVCT